MNARRQLHPAVLAVAGVVATAAFAFSADSWVQLAEIAGFRTHWNIGARTVYLSWLMPIAFDAYTALATWSYFTAQGATFRRYAKRNALGSAALSVIVQGAYHGLKANHVDVASKWGLVVAVGAIPAALLAAVVHLIAEYLRDRQPAAPTDSAAQMTESSGHEPAAPATVPAVPQVARTPQLDTPPAPELDTPVDPRLATPTIADLATLTTTIPAPHAGGSNGTGWPPTTGVNGHQLATLTRPAARVAKQPARGGSNKVSNRGGPGRKPAAQEGVKESKAARQKRVAKLLAADPDAGAKKVANQLGIPVSTARNDLTELRAPKES